VYKNVDKINYKMPTTIIQGKRVHEVELLDVFPSSEGMICQYYGRIGSGKTYAATYDILDLLRRGKVVYVNWKINYQGYDERSSFFRVATSLVFPWIRRFYFFPKENLKNFEISNEWAVKQGFIDFDDWVKSITDAYMFADEGHVWFDSYVGTRIPMERRNIALHTRHFNRTICIITQRPTAIHVTMRANVNIFYKCEKIWQWGNILRFKRSEFQDLLNESVDESEEALISTKFYWGKKKVFNAYDTKYLRGTQKISQKVAFEAYNLGIIDKIKALFSHVIRKKIHTGNPQETSLNNAPMLLLGHVNQPSTSHDETAGKQGVVSAIWKESHETPAKTHNISNEVFQRPEIQGQLSKRKVATIPKRSMDKRKLKRKRII
jgi:hypothetical protein